MAISTMQVIRTLTPSPEPVEEHDSSPTSPAMMESPLQAAKIQSPSPKPVNVTSMGDRSGRSLRSSKGHTHHLDARPPTVPEPIRISHDTWLFELSDRKLWVRSQEPIDWKQVGRMMKDHDLGYDSEETIDDPIQDLDCIPIEEASDRRTTRSSSQNVEDASVRYQSDAKMNQSTHFKEPQEAITQSRQDPASSLSSQTSESGYDSHESINQSTEAAHNSEPTMNDTMDIAYESGAGTEELIDAEDIEERKKAHGRVLRASTRLQKIVETGKRR